MQISGTEQKDETEDDEKVLYNSISNITNNEYMNHVNNIDRTRNICISQEYCKFEK